MQKWEASVACVHVWVTELTPAANSQQICRARGMRAPFGEGAAIFMRKQLKEWLDLSLNRALPSSLLLLSRAFTVTQPLESPTPDTPYESLKETISALPNKARPLLPLLALLSLLIIPSQQ